MRGRELDFEKGSECDPSCECIAVVHEHDTEEQVTRRLSELESLYQSELKSVPRIFFPQNHLVCQSTVLLIRNN